MKRDEVNEILMNGELLEFASLQIEGKRGKKRSKDYVVARLRNLGRLVLEGRKATSNSTLNLIDMMDPTQFPLIIACTHSLMRTEKGDFASKVIGRKLGIALKRVAEIAKSKAIISRNITLQQLMKDFLAVHAAQWTDGKGKVNGNDTKECGLMFIGILCIDF